MMKIVSLCLTVLALCSCATIRETNNNSTWREQNQPLWFQAEGRMGVKINQTGYTASFDWLRTPKIETFTIYSPLGNALVAICQDHQGAMARDWQGKVYQAANVEALSEQVLGEAIPMQYLAWWTSGQWMKDLPHQLHQDGSLSQLDWSISREIGEEKQLKTLTVRRAQTSLQLLFQEIDSPSSEQNARERCESIK